MTGFDLIEYLNTARGINKPAELFRLWEDVCRKYDKGQIGSYELDEMKSVIMPNLKSLSVLQSAVDSSFMQTQTS